MKTLCSLILALTVTALGAQTPHDAIYRDRSADRDARLVANAKREGRVVLYTSLAHSESMPLAQAFERKYGIPVELWRAPSARIVQRVMTEAQGRRHAVDVVETNGPEMEMLAREGLLGEFYSPHLADLPAAAIPPHRRWFPDRMNYFVVAYNTRRVQRAEIPATYEGFLDPRWKGRIALEATDFEWMATLMKAWGETRGMDFFRKLAAMNPSMRRSHVLLAELVAAGEVPVALTAYSSNVEPLRKKGAPIDFVPVQPVAGRPQGIGVTQQAPHPHAALLFADMVLSPEGQTLLESMGRVPASSKVKSRFNDFSFTLIEPASVLDEAPKWEKVWRSLFASR